MPAQLLSLDTVGRPDYPSEPLFLDPTCAGEFWEWLRDAPQLDELREGKWRVLVFDEHRLSLAPELQKHTKETRRIGGTSKSTNPALWGRSQFSVRSEDRWMIDELQRLAFEGDMSRRPQAELLYLARRARNGRAVNLISNCHRLGQLPDVSCFFVPGRLEAGALWPFGFEPFRDLNFHPRLRDVAQTAFDSRLFPVAIEESVKAIEAEVAAKYVCTQTGAQLMKEAFSCEYSRNPAVRRAPRLPLNRWNLSDSAHSGTESEGNEMVGLAAFFAGIHPSLRNPTAHDTHDNIWLQNRFGDARRTVKWLGFLSVLMEILDKPYKT